MVSLLAACFVVSAGPNAADYEFKTDQCRLKVSRTGMVTSIRANKTGKDYSPASHPSPIMCLNKAGQLVQPLSAAYKPKSGELALDYPEGEKATIKIGQTKGYFKFELLSLEPRKDVDGIVWGPINTTINKTIGDLIGVVRDGDIAIGMLGLNDNTITGTPCDGDFAPMLYFIHSPDPDKNPVPAPYKEGQIFNIGGDGVSDVAFFSHPEEFFQMAFGNGAKLEPEFGSSIAYHSRDRQKSYTHKLSLLPGFPASRPRHQVTDPIEGVDFIGSKVALYVCPDEKGLETIRTIIQAEGLPYIENYGKWVRDPDGFRPDIAWWGPHDKLIEYANALNLKAVQDEGQGEYYANAADLWQGPRVKFNSGTIMSYNDYTKELKKHGIKYGLHTLCLFLQPNWCTDVSPKASAGLQTVLRTELAKDVKPDDTTIEVTDPSYLAEDGTWPMRDGSNTLRIGTELLHYDGISAQAPWILTGIKRGFAGTRAQYHNKGDELVKLQMNCYNGYAPDMKLMLAYADWYAKVLNETGMEYIDFDGLESAIYQGHGYYGVRVFLRRLFDSYKKLNPTAQLRVMGSCVFPSGWEYMGVCNIGGGNHMFDPVLNKWGIEGKDVRYGFGNSYFAATFGIQSYQSDWCEYDAENLQAKSIGWDAMYMLGLSEDAVEKSGEKEAIFTSFRAWEDARELGVFKPAVKSLLKDMNLKFHLERLSTKQFELTPIEELRQTQQTSPAGCSFTLMNAQTKQPLEFSLRFKEPLNGITMTLPDGLQLGCEVEIATGQFVTVKGQMLIVADQFRKPIRQIKLRRLANLPHGPSSIRVESKSTGNLELTLWIKGKPQKLKA